MNLQDFIGETFKQIIDGVIDAQEHAAKKNAYKNLPITRYSGGRVEELDDSLPKPQMIEFDIAVTTNESKDIKGGVGIFVAGLGIGYKANKDITDSKISKIKFSIPIILPKQI